MSVSLVVDLARLMLCSRELLDAIQGWARQSGNRFAPGLDDEIDRSLHAIAWRALGSHRLEQIELAMDTLRAGGVEPDELPAAGGGRARVPAGRKIGFEAAFTALARRFLVTRGWRIAFRFEALGELSRLAKHVECCQLQAFAWATGDHCDQPWDGHLSCRELLARARGPLLPRVADPLIESLAERGLAEVHRHFNGSASPLLLWLGLLDGDPGLGAAYLRTRRHGSSRARIRADTVADQRAWLRLARGLRRGLIGVLRGDPEAPVRLGAVLAARDHGVHRLHRDPGAPAARVPGTGHERALYLRRDAVGERVLLYRLFARCRDEDDARVRAAVHAYLLAQNLTLSSIVHPVDDRLGLSRFAHEYAQAPAREQTENSHKQRLVQARRAGAVRRLEARLSPSGSPRSRLRRLRRAWANRAAREPESVPDHIGVVFHFIRDRDVTDPGRSILCPPRHAALRARVGRQAQAIVHALRHPELGAMVVGLDVAGQETAARNEVFAPAIRFVRAFTARTDHLPWWRDGDPVERAERPALRLTCHAGEDFEHLLSGMRAIDEAVQFLAMEPGDRIGHGLALGYEPAQWAEACGGRVYHRAGPWLDDLVWFHQALLAAGCHGPVQVDVQARIDELAPWVYPGRSPPASLLYKAWRWRDVDPDAAALVSERGSGLWSHHLITGSGRSFARHELGARGFDRGRPDVDLWWAYHRDRQVRQRSLEPIAVTVEASWLPALRQVQDWLLARLVQRRIAIEINPSSNLSVGILRDLTEHPVFRWYGPDAGAGQREQAPFVVVGSDDPGIFATELLHEYAYLAHAAMRRGASPRAVARWIESLRQASSDFCFVRAGQTREPGAGAEVERGWVLKAATR